MWVSLNNSLSEPLVSICILPKIFNKIAISTVQASQTIESGGTILGKLVSKYKHMSNATKKTKLYSSGAMMIMAMVTIMTIRTMIAVNKNWITRAEPTFSPNGIHRLNGCRRGVNSKRGRGPRSQSSQYSSSSVDDFSGSCRFVFLILSLSLEHFWLSKMRRIKVNCLEIITYKAHRYTPQSTRSYADT